MLREGAVGDAVREYPMREWFKLVMRAQAWEMFVLFATAHPRSFRSHTNWLST